MGGSRFSTTPSRAWLIVTSLVVATGSIYFLDLSGAETLHDRVEIPWWGLAIAFAAAESWVVHLHFKSETGSFSLFELPLVLGLIFATPQSLLIATVVGPGLALAFVRRQPPIKVVFNVANLSLHAAIAATIAHWALSGDPLAPVSWLILVGSTLVGGGIQIVALAAVIVVTEGTLERKKILTMLATGAVISSANTSLALVAAILIATEPLSLIPLGATIVVLFAAYRAYVSERTQRERVEFLYSSTKALRDSPETTTAAAALLDEAASMFRAARAELYLFPRPGEPGAISLFRYDSGTTVSLSVADGAEAEELAVLGSVPVIVDFDAGDNPTVETLARSGVRDAMVGALHGANREVAVLVVANRLGTVTSFNAEDLRLFETLVQHAAVALENDQLEQALGEMRRLERDLAHQANHDTLTGLANRALFGDQLAQHIDHADAVTVLYIDLDDFKVINDTLGHDAGDHVLTEVGRRIESVIRPTDTAARLGGDEFAVVLPESEQPLLVARRIIQALHDPFLVGEHDVQVGASIGLATAEEKIEPSILLNDADVAMYAAKSNGKGSVVEFHSTMRDQVSRQRRIRTQLRRAIDLDEFEVAYQPIVDLASGRVAGAEALVRWNAEEGLQMPATFIGEAERAGLIVPIDRNVLSKVVTRLGEADGALSDIPFISVNLSARNFQQDDLTDFFARTLMDAGAAPSRIVVEITETALLRDPDRTVELLAELKELGLRVALDDFGTGYSSLSYLRRLPVDILKIAQPFVSDVAEDDTFVRTMVDLGKNLGLTIVAEGIEEPVQHEILLSLGCDLGQGYLFAQPMNHESMAEQLRSGESLAPAGNS